MTATRTAALGAEEQRRALVTEHLNSLVGVVWQVPKRWIALMIGLAILSSVHVQRGADGDYGVDVSVGTLAVVSLGLIWLPALLRLFLLTGGSLKAGGVEAAATGMLSREDLMEVLTRAKAVTTLPEDQLKAAHSAMVELDAAVDRLAYDAFDSAHSLSSDVLRGLALEYERLRRDSGPGAQRTSAMTRIVNETRVRAASSTELASSKALPLLRSKSQGERIVGLALAQEAAPPESFIEVLRLVRNSATAFEMFHALLALQEIAPFLDDSQVDQAIASLIQESDDPRGVGIHDDAGLPNLLKRTLLQLKSRGAQG